MDALNTSPSNITILNAVTSALSQYIGESDPQILFQGLLKTMLTLTDSEYGFIGEVFYYPDGKPYVKPYVTTNITWDQDSQQLYERTMKEGFEINCLKSLYGSILTSGQVVISSMPKHDPRSGGTPKGHPSLKSFMGMPFYGENKLLGIVGIANRAAGYQKTLATQLEPFLITCGNLILAYRKNKKHLQIEHELEQYKAQLSNTCTIVSLGNSYEFNLTQPTLTHENQLVSLTQKELHLLEELVKNRNSIVNHQTLEDAIWQNALVTDSSLRSLVKRLRKKAPGITIKTIPGVGYSL